MKQVERYRRKKKLVASQWPSDLDSPDVLATRVRYTGSAEHKDYPSFAGSPALRSDATRCEKSIGQEEAEEMLKEAVRRGLVSEDSEGGYPRYIWGRLRGEVYIARLINQGQGWYKGWRLDDELEWPDDPRLRREVW